MSTILAPRDITTKLNYMKWEDYYKTEKLLLVGVKDDPRKTNVVMHQGLEEMIYDVRGKEFEYTLDTNGFQFVKHETGLTPEEFKDHAIVESRYLPESIALFKAIIDNIDEIHIVNWQNRSSDNGMGGISKEVSKEVHVDLSKPEIEKRIRKIFPDRADYLLKGRVRMVNIWRPISGPVKNWPLVVSDAQSISPDKILEFDRVLPGQLITARYGIQDPNTKWYYLNEQQQNEVLLFKNYDSDNSVAQGIPHTSVELPNAAPDTPARESCEVRAFLFTYPTDA
ncbi:hypothetical protein F5884DRAFT_863518 [Xylogone sp. PMI_703]|nr:hypothetical protein F5884DRAFT_863518 [Xylogone sp. PMI_703]